MCLKTLKLLSATVPDKRRYPAFWVSPFYVQYMISNIYLFFNLPDLLYLALFDLVLFDPVLMVLVLMVLVLLVLVLLALGALLFQY